MTAYYNEVDPYAAQWLRNLIQNGHIAPGVVDERDLRDVRPEELRDFTQCHFFAGIGIWSHALRAAGWPDDRPVWTGSCPCQPFSAAGRRNGTADERHLWPHWFHLISQCKPEVVLGEQVASKDGLGWFDLVQDDLEAADYAAAAFDLCAAGFSGAHIRQRLYFVGVGDAQYPRLEGQHRADASTQGRTQQGGSAPEAGLPDGLEHADLLGCKPVGHAERGGVRKTSGRSRSDERAGHADAGVLSGGTGTPLVGRTVVDWLLGEDGSWRPVEPGTSPLGDAHPCHMDLLRAYGNALDAETAKNFIESVMECLQY